MIISARSLLFISACLLLFSCDKENQSSELGDDEIINNERIDVRSLPKDELEKMVETCINQDHQHGAFQNLKAQEALVADLFIDALSRPDAFTPRKGGYGDTECRARQILSFLSDGTHPQLIPVLKEIFERGDQREIKIISFPMASFANMDVFDETERLLKNSDAAISGKAQFALQLALERRKVSTEFKEKIWQACEAVFLSDSSPDLSSFSNTSKLLMTLDSKRAVSLFKSSGVLELDHPSLLTVIDELIKNETPPDETFLLSVLDKKDSPKAFTQKRLHALALIGLAQLKSPHAEQRIADTLNSEMRFDEYVGLAAWEARFKLTDKPQLSKSAIDNYFANQQDFEKISKDEQRVNLISYADAIFSNAGVGGWFEGHEGQYTAEVLEALEYFGAKDHAKLFKQMADILAPDGSIADNKKREKILKHLSESKSIKLDKLTDEWYKLPNWELYVNEWNWNHINRP
jgi:hypothetical protein